MARAESCGPTVLPERVVTAWAFFQGKRCLRRRSIKKRIANKTLHLLQTDDDKGARCVLQADAVHAWEKS